MTRKRSSGADSRFPDTPAFSVLHRPKQRHVSPNFHLDFAMLAVHLKWCPATGLPQFASKAHNGPEKCNFTLQCQYYLVLYGSRLDKWPSVVVTASCYCEPLLVDGRWNTLHVSVGLNTSFLLAHQPINLTSWVAIRDEKINRTFQLHTRAKTLSTCMYRSMIDGVRASKSATPDRLTLSECDVQKEISSTAGWGAIICALNNRIWLSSRISAIDVVEILLQAPSLKSLWVSAQLGVLELLS
jgi:hypothetical protein